MQKTMPHSFRTAILVAALAALPSSLAFGAANPQLLGLLPPDAKAIAGLQVDQVKNSGFGQFFLTRMTKGTGFDKLLEETGFDPRTDLAEVIAAGSGPGAGLIAARGNFQPTRLQSLANQHGATSSVYRGITIVTAQPKHDAEHDTEHDSPIEAVSVAFLDASTAVAGQPADVQAAIDRWIGSTEASGALFDRAISISATTDAWGVSVSPAELHPGQLDHGVPPEVAAIAGLLQKITGLSGGVDFGASDIAVQGEALTATPADARSMADVLLLLKALQEQRVPFAASAQVTTNGSSVNLNLTLSEAEVEQLLNPALNQGAPQNARRDRGARSQAR